MGKPAVAPAEDAQPPAPVKRGRKPREESQFDSLAKSLKEAFDTFVSLEKKNLKLRAALADHVNSEASALFDFISERTA